MCGIIGYLGDREATPILMESLKRLEYRGYDSAGVAVLADGAGADRRTSVTKSETKVDVLIEKLQANMPTGKLGIGHTRWATHGKPTYINAHPHTDCHQRIYVVHNGIIENFAELKSELEAKGHEFTSDTDTEVVPHLIEANYKGDFLAAVRAALKRLRGAYAMAMFSTDDPELLVGARLNAPLVVGLGEKEYYVASDITAIIPYTKRVLVLGEGEVAAVTPLGPQVYTLDGHSVTPKLIHVDWDVTQAQKGGYPHFMLKEINESSEAVANAMRGRLTDDGAVTFREFDIPDQDLKKYREVLLLGMGTSLHAAMIGEQVIEDWAGIPARAEDASEFRYRRPTFGKHTLGVVITQSGETADTLVGLHQAKERGALTVAITNVVASSAARDADGAIALLDDQFPVVAICTASSTKDKMVSNVHEIVARNAPVLALITKGDKSLDGVATDVFEMPEVEEAAAAILNSVMLQLFAYHVAVELGQNVDQPRNLAKSVTVE